MYLKVKLKDDQDLGQLYKAIQETGISVEPLGDFSNLREDLDKSTKEVLEAYKEYMASLDKFHQVNRKSQRASMITFFILGMISLMFIPSSSYWYLHAAAALLSFGVAFYYAFKLR